MTLYEINKRLAKIVELIKTSVEQYYQTETTYEEYKIISRDFQRVCSQIETDNIINAGIKCNSTPIDEWVKDFHTLDRLYLHLKEEHHKMVSRTILHQDYPSLKKKYSS